MMWIKITDYINKKIEHIDKNKDFLKNKITNHSKAALRQILGDDIDKIDISFAGKSILIKTQSPVLKQKIFLKKEKIINEINKNTALSYVDSIRFQ
ncbi:hypothetical protein ACFL3E_01340 [Patescibacteria group bacterium]